MKIVIKEAILRFSMEEEIQTDAHEANKFVSNFVHYCHSQRFLHRHLYVSCIKTPMCLWHGCLY